MAVYFSVYTAEYLKEIIIHEKNDMKTGQPGSMTSICHANDSQPVWDQSYHNIFTVNKLIDPWEMW